MSWREPPQRKRHQSRHGRAAPAPEVGLIEELTERELAVLRYLPRWWAMRPIALSHATTTFDPSEFALPAVA